MDAVNPIRAWCVRDLGRQPYEPVWHAMQAFTDGRGPDTPDELWLVEHEPVFTLGQAGRWEHLLDAGPIPVVPVDRGGQITYHGPGQIVAYPMVDLRRIRLGVRELVQRIEQAVIEVLAGYGIQGARREGAPGVYVGEAKVMALGLRVRRGCSFHGLAFNIAMDVSPYARINPCGFRGLAVTTVVDLGGPGDLAAVKPPLVAALSRQLGLEPRPEPGLPEPLLSATAA
ncbi:MAG TPA: lipoyl(octanoyl) transferase LipB [Xanthomonadaceae bacterium]|nr:lipoyl(octanoyl) transferase LipB [Xanthomonadaceae bacterium]